MWGLFGLFGASQKKGREKQTQTVWTDANAATIVITEALIGDALLPHFPEITMTFDQTTLFTRLHSVTCTLADGTNQRAVPVVTNIDFEKWNSNMRIELILRIFSDFDRLFG